MSNHIEPLESRNYFSSVIPASLLDPSFGAGGTAITPIRSDNTDGLTAVALQRDGAVVSAGWTRPQASYLDPGGLLITRHLINGQPDPTFGPDATGQVVMPTAFGSDGGPIALVVQRDDKIVLAFPQPGGVQFLRLLPSGQPDLTFGEEHTGRALVPVDGDALYTRAALLRPGGKILVAGSLTFNDPRYRRRHDQMLFIQLNADGTVDANFGDHHTGVSVFGTKYDDTARALAVDAAGRVVVAGAVRGDLAAIRLTADGHRDLTFAASAQFPGFATADFGAADEFASGVVALADGRTVIAGNTHGDFALASFDATGRRGQLGARGDLGGDADAVVQLLHRDADPDTFYVVGATGYDEPNSRFAVVPLRIQNSIFVSIPYGDGNNAQVDAGPGPDTARAAAIYKDGRIVIAGEAINTIGDGKLLRLTPAGLPDPTFSGDGKLLIARTGPVSFSVNQTIRQPDGKILVIGASDENPDSTPIFVRRYNPDGSLDASFGAGGAALPRIVGSGVDPFAMLRADGKIVVVLPGFEGGIMNPVNVLFVVRLNADGSPDASFAPDGVRRLPQITDSVSAMAVDAAGRIILAAQGAAGLVIPPGQVAAAWTVIRLNAAGDVDTSFGDHGTTTTTFDGHTFGNPTEIRVAPDGSFTVVGRLSAAANPSIHNAAAAARYDATGHLDTSYGTLGKTTVTFDPDIQIDLGGFFVVKILPDGSTLFGGSATTAGGENRRVLGKLTPAGDLDPAFGQSGEALDPHHFPTHDGSPTTIDTILDLTVLADGRILALTAQRTPSNGLIDPFATEYLVRYLPDGEFDPTFGDNGGAEVVTDRLSYVGSMLPLPDGRVLFAGLSDSDILLARLAPSPSTAPGVFATRVGDELRITGTAADDLIRLRRDRATGRLTIDGVQTPDTTGVTRITIQSLAGNDRIDISAATVPVTIDAGEGNDLLLGGSADDNLQGNAGHDTLFGGRGDDTLHGNDGNDYLNGGPGADHLFGDAGNDQIFSLDLEPDQIDAGPGFDRVKSDDLDDVTAAEAVLA